MNCLGNRRRRIGELSSPKFSSPRACVPKGGAGPGYKGEEEVVLMWGPFMEEFGFGGKESHMFAMEFPRMLEHTLMRTLEIKKAHNRQKPQKSPEPGEPST